MTVGLVVVGVIFVASSGIAALCAKIIMPAAKEFGKDLYQDFKDGYLK